MNARGTRVWSMRAGAFCLCAGALGSSLACEGKYAPPTAPSVQPTTTSNPGTYSVAGTVREVNGAPLTGVTVTVQYPPGASTSTDSTGAFSLADVPPAWLRFQKDGFRTTDMWLVDFALNGRGPLIVKMQPLFVLSAEAEVSSVITNDDLSYSSVEDDGSFWNGTYSCAPCKEIVVRPIRDGGRLRLHWTGPTPLDLWAGGGYSGVSAHAAGAAGESELVLDVPRGRLDTVLVGVGPRNGRSQTLTATESFHLTIEP